jgi:flagellar motility protein MotE (MotC chaperone)
MPQQEVIRMQQGLKEDAAAVRVSEAASVGLRERSVQVVSAVREKASVRSQLQERRKGCWREGDALSVRLSEARAELDKSKQQLSSSLPKAVSLGLASVEAIAADLGISGYFGPVIANFTL